MKTLETSVLVTIAAVALAAGVADASDNKDVQELGYAYIKP